jgi:outer membrane lipoprotein SlyB
MQGNDNPSGTCMKVLNGLPVTLQPGALPTRRLPRFALIGAAFGLFALGALGAALVLEGPSRATAAPPAPLAAVARGANTAARAHGSDIGTAVDTQAAAMPACSICGIVEAATPVHQKGQGSGLGAVAGGVLGGVLGHQLGGGGGRRALTVIGAVGGGIAGNEIEKRQRATTVYQLKIRMADGSLRTLTRPQPMAVGQRVHVDGDRITPVADNDVGNGPKMLQAAERPT